MRFKPSENVRGLTIASGMPHPFFCHGFNSFLFNVFKPVCGEILLVAKSPLLARHTLQAQYQQLTKSLTQFKQKLISTSGTMLEDITQNDEIFSHP